MPKNNPDLNQNAPDHAGAALIIIDMINDLEFPGGEQLLGPALQAALRIADLKNQANRLGMPVIFANDNFGRWRSNFSEVVEHCLNSDVRGGPLVEALRPSGHDYFVLKPKHSAFYATPLDLLLEHLSCRKLILVGISGDMCVQFSACDAYMRDFQLLVPEDCVASCEEEQNQKSLAYMRDQLGADIRPSSSLDLEGVLGGS